MWGSKRIFCVRKSILGWLEWGCWILPALLFLIIKHPRFSPKDLFHLWTSLKIKAWDTNHKSYPTAMVLQEECQIPSWISLIRQLELFSPWWRAGKFRPIDPWLGTQTQEKRRWNFRWLGCISWNWNLGRNPRLTPSTFPPANRAEGSLTTAVVEPGLMSYP